MNETNDAAPAPEPDEPNGRREIFIDGDATGTIVAGDLNTFISAHGSWVNVLPKNERPQPVRRARIEQLPRPQREPLGRAELLATLAEATRFGYPVQLYGPPGIGKSTVLRYAALTLEPGPDGVVFLNAGGRDIGDLAQEIFEACYDAPGYAPTQAALRRYMTGIQVKVYLDDADLTLEQQRNLADLAPHASFVLAGAQRSLLEDVTVVEVAGLERTPALQLLGRDLRKPLPGTEIPAATELWRIACGHPLLLMRAAGQIELDASGRPTLPKPGRVADLLPPLFDQLDPTATAVLHLLATLGDVGLAPEHIGALTDAADPARHCARLTELGLAVPAEDGYRCAPDIVAALRHRHPEPFPVDRLCAHFISWAHRPGTEATALARCDRALERVSELAELARRPELVVQLARATAHAMPRALRFGAWGRLLGRGWRAAELVGDRRAAAYFMHEEGIRNLLLRRVAAGALLGTVAATWHELGEINGQLAAQHAQQYAAGGQPSDVLAGAPAPQPDPATMQTATAHMQGFGPDPSGSVGQIGWHTAVSGGAQPNGGDPSLAGHSSSGAPDSNLLGHTDPGATAVHTPGSGTTGPYSPGGTGTGTTIPGPPGDSGVSTSGPYTPGHGGISTTDPHAPGHGGISTTDPYTPGDAGTSTLYSPGHSGTGAPTPSHGGTTAHSVSIAPPGGPAAGTVGTTSVGAAKTAGAAVATLGKIVAGIVAAVAAFAVVSHIAAAVRDESAASDAAQPTATHAAPTYPPRTTPASAPTGIVGSWHGSAGGFTISAAGAGAYILEFRSVDCGGTTRYRITGNDRSASGLVDAVDPHCTRNGQGRLTVSVSPDGNTLTRIYSANGTLRNCTNCGTAFFTRVH
ncbi:ATP-binding protein [Nocardia panacis]|uniref:ATP-binding protein n=1 Tax=Nocardia panacis TaxID=2340916 RepID=A0A3A4JW32_9NOCA|nr:ATP-binding protein [Nocardia panacis]RJO70832.1 ATP-binding protein [Nocardia panacis]